MKNYTSAPTEFHILPFSYKDVSPTFMFGLFTAIYLLGVLMNVLIVTLIYLDQQLHSPMYLFLCNLSFVDLCYTTTIIPKLLHMLLSGNYTMSFTQCFTQMFFLFLAAGTENLLLFIMAYDRYVAICRPLHYHSILSKKVYSTCMAAIWFFGSINSYLIIVPAMKMSFCNSTTIHHLFCDAKALTKISCTGKELFFSVIYFEIFASGFCPFVCSCTSYARILQVVVHIKSGDGRKKAFSTCSSHLTVIMLYYGTAVSMYLLPSSSYSDVLDQVFTLVYAAVTPMLNPVIYSLRNKEVKMAAMKLLQLK